MTVSAELDRFFTWAEYVANQAATRGVNYKDTDPDEIVNIEVIGSLNDGTELYRMVPSELPEKSTELPEDIGQTDQDPFSGPPLAYSDGSTKEVTDELGLSEPPTGGEQVLSSEDNATEDSDDEDA